MRLSPSRQLIVGQVVGQMALVLVIPALTRMVDPASMGIYQVAFSVALIAQPAATLRLELVIPTSHSSRRRKERAVGLLVPTVTAAVSIAVGVAVLAGLGAEQGSVVVAAGLILLAMAIVSIENAVLLRAGALGRLALRNLISGVLAAALQIALAALWPTALSLAIALLVGRLVATLLTPGGSGVGDNDDEKPDLGRRGFARTTSAILSGTVSNAATQSIVIATFIALGPAAAALVGVAQRVAGTPTTLVGQALAQSTLADAAPLIRAQRFGLASLVSRALKKYVAFAAILAIGMMILAPPLAGPVLGEEWASAGTLIAIFAVPLCLQLATIPTSNLLVPLRKEHQLLLLQSLRLVVVTGVIFGTAVLIGNLTLVFVSTALIWSLAYGALIAYTLWAARQWDRICASDEKPQDERDNPDANR
jgi:O-antigen/teichoic acid export membrane protein